jgi:hypothetical protein
MSNYSIKWKVNLSNEYKEYLLNLFYQEYFSELWEVIQKQNFEASRIFVEEINKMQFEVISKYLNKKHLNI